MITRAVIGTQNRLRSRKHGRDEQRQRELRIEPELGRIRHEGERDAAEREHRGVGQFEITRDAREHHGADQQGDDPFEGMHVGHSSDDLPGCRVDDTLRLA
jgi:hypothetical protein